MTHTKAQRVLSVTIASMKDAAEILEGEGYYPLAAALLRDAEEVEMIAEELTEKED